MMRMFSIYMAQHGRQEKLQQVGLSCSKASNQDFVQVTMYKEHGCCSSAAVRGLFVVSHKGILTYRSAATVQNRDVCFL